MIVKNKMKKFKQEGRNASTSPVDVRNKSAVYNKTTRLLPSHSRPEIKKPKELPFFGNEMSGAVS